MSHSTHQKNHDNCPDCIRQRQQNAALISIYQRLQDIKIKTSSVQSSLQTHRIKNQTNRSFFQNYNTQLKSLPKNNKSVMDSKVVGDLGYELAASLYESQTKKGVEGQNAKLRAKIKMMEKQKRNRCSLEALRAQQRAEEKQQRTLVKTGCSADSDKSINKSYPMQTSAISARQLQKSLLFGQTGRSSDNKTTHFSSFRVTRMGNSMGNSMDMGKYNDLNLWLYQNKDHAKLQSQLFLSRPRASLRMPATDRRLPLLKR